MPPPTTPTPGTPSDSDLTPGDEAHSKVTAASGPPVPVRSRVVALSAIAGSIAVVAMVAAVAAMTGIPIREFTRDVSQLAGVDFYTGSVGTINLVLWGSAAALAAFVSRLVPQRRFALAAFCALTIVLLIDDLLLVHELVGPELGIPEPVFYVLYALAAGIVVWTLSPLRVGPAGWAMLAAGTLLGASIAIDLVEGAPTLLEDGLKLVGSALWTIVPVLVHSFAQRPASRLAVASAETGAQ